MRAFPLALGVIGLIWLIPFVWLVLASFKSLPELVTAPFVPLPERFAFDNYAEVFRVLPVGRYLWNTVLMAALIALLQIALALPAAYALAKLRFRGRALSLGLMLAALLLPAQVRFVPVFVLLAELRWVNSLAALVLPFGASAYGTLWFTQALQNVPDSYVESARLDGASEAVIVYRILAPILAPTLSAFFIFSFVLHYNDYFWPLVMTTDDAVRTLPLGVALLHEQGSGVRWNVLLAANVLSSLPAIALFVLAQRHLIDAATRRTRADRERASQRKFLAS